ncbi:PP2C family serine/threonine-protein phosphatase [Providencia stuartii]|uniref:PP2C family protein-serine/threonine phosphatase n=1 Tax=Providencia stuartii TaxID=588 RepID=UPI0033331AFC
MGCDSYEVLREQIHRWLHRKNISSSVRRVSTLPVAIASDIGLVRTENQDRVAVLKFQPSGKLKDIIVVALADGMGGMEGGANAASITISTLFSEMVKNSNLPIRSCIEKAVLAASKSVFNIYRGNGGATLSVIVFDGNSDVIAINIGDSRIYSLEDHSIKQLSEDDTLAVLARKFNNTNMTNNDSDIDSKFGGELVQFIGLEGPLEIHYIEINMLSDATILLSSDGAHLIGNDNLRRLFNHSSNTAIYCKRVIELASWFGGLDNASVAAIELAKISNELKTTSGEVVNIWDSFGELKIINIANKIFINDDISKSESDLNNKKENSNDVNNRSVIQKRKDEELKKGKNKNPVTKNNFIDKKIKVKNKKKSTTSSSLNMKAPNDDEKLENISKKYITYFDSNEVEGDKGDK